MDLLEVSIVGIPSNADAVKRAYEDLIKDYPKPNEGLATGGHFSGSVMTEGSRSESEAFSLPIKIEDIQDKGRSVLEARLSLLTLN